MKVNAYAAKEPQGKLEPFPMNSVNQVQNRLTLKFRIAGYAIPI